MTALACLAWERADYVAYRDSTPVLLPKLTRPSGR